MAALKLIFMGSPDFSVPALTALLEAGHEVICVYAQPPRPAGRGQKERPCPVHAFAEQRGIEVRTPKSLKDDRAQQAFADLHADACVVAAYGLILPKEILDAPRLGCLNIHASLLPRWRGAAPIHRAILDGDEKSGVTIMQMDEGLDTGDMLMVAETPISLQTTATDLHDRLSEMGAEMIVKTLDGLQSGTLNPIPQPDDGVTYAAKLDRSEGKIDWSLGAEDLERRVRGLNPWPGVWFDHQGQRIKVLAADVVDVSGKVATLLDDRLTVACGDKAIRLTRVQKQGKGPMAAEDFLRGNDVPKGTVFQ